MKLKFKSKKSPPTKGLPSQKAVLIRKPVEIPKKSFHPSDPKRLEKLASGTAVKGDSEPTTKPVNLRLPIDLLDYFRDNYSPGYQTKIKEILTEYMEDNPV